MANIFVHFEPIGPVGDDIDVDPDLPQYIIRGTFLLLEKKNGKLPPLFLNFFR